MESESQAQEIQLSLQVKTILEKAKGEYANSGMGYRELLNNLSELLKQSRVVFEQSREAYEKFLLESIRLSRSELGRLGKRSIENIVSLSCAYFNYDIDAITDEGNGKGGSVLKLEIPHIIMATCYRYLDISGQKIGMYFKRDHSTILYCDKKIANMCDTDKSFRQKYVDYIKYLLVEDVKVERGVLVSRSLKETFPDNFKQKAESSCIL